MRPAEFLPPIVRRWLPVTIAVPAMWAAVSGLTWWLPHEDALRHFVAWCLLLLTAPGIILMSLSRRATLLGLLAAFVHLAAVWVAPTPVGIALTAGLLALAVALRHALDVGDWPYVGRGFGCVWLSVYVALTPWPFYLWPWSTIRGDIAQALHADASALPAAGQVLAPDHPRYVSIRHPLFLFPIGLERYPAGSNVRYAAMYFGDGRFAKIDTHDPMSFLDASN